MRAAPAALLLLLVTAAGCSTAPAPDQPGTTTATASTSPTVTPGTTSTSGPPPGASEIFFDFGGETEGSGDLSGWTPRADVPQDPNVPGKAVAWSVEACDDAGWEDHVHIQAHPVHSLCITLDGRQGDGTVWVARSLGVQRGTSYLFNVTVRAYGEESANRVADLVLRLGADGGARTEADFTLARGENHAALRRPLDQASGWAVYHLEWLTPPLAVDQVTLDVGVSAVWETQMTRYLDAVSVRILPAGS